MDAITVLRDDHKRVESLFKQFEKLGEDGPTQQKLRIVGEIVRELSVHAAVEEQAFYPAVRKNVPDADDTVLEGLEEHHIVKWTLSELDGMEGDEERFDAKVTVLIESVRHHVEEEEGEMFPKVREAMGRKALQELAETMERVRRSAPTHPHPKAPDEPPANLVAGAAAGLADRAADKSGLFGRRRDKAGTKS
jgi:hemerythrin superfamily protein